MRSAWIQSHAQDISVFAGGPGTDHHIPFPIAIRAAYGYYFSNFCVVSRACLSAVWFGVNTYYGSFIITEVRNIQSRINVITLTRNNKIIAALWPSYRDIPNQLPASSYITTQQMCSYILYCIVQTPFLMIPVEKLKYETKVFPQRSALKFCAQEAVPHQSHTAGTCLRGHGYLDMCQSRQPGGYLPSARDCHRIHKDLVMVGILKREHKLLDDKHPKHVRLHSIQQDKVSILSLSHRDLRY